MLCIYIYGLYGISQVFPWLTSLTMKLVKIPATLNESWGAGLEPRPEVKKQKVAICWDYFISHMLHV